MDETVRAVAASLANFAPSMGRQTWEAAARAAIDAYLRVEQDRSVELLDRTGELKRDMEQLKAAVAALRREWRLVSPAGVEITRCTEPVALRYAARFPHTRAEFRPVGDWERAA